MRETKGSEGEGGEARLATWLLSSNPLQSPWTAAAAAGTEVGRAAAG